MLNGVDLTVKRGEMWGLVGETGCGKSVTGLSVSRLLPSPPARYLQGEIRFMGEDVLGIPEARMRALRGRRIGMIFQDPTTNLNPSFRIGEQLVDVALAAGRHSPEILGLDASASSSDRRAAARRLAVEMLAKVGIPEPGERIDAYPHQFSGGMRQRVLIAMALIGRPDLLVADEPTTALDATVQKQVLALITGMVPEYGMGLLLITHNLAMVAQSCTHVAVMYAGSIVEQGPVGSVLRDPGHPYTRALLSAIPTAKVARGGLRGLAGTVPNLIDPPPGCRFAPRCALAIDDCRSAKPAMAVLRGGHSAACIRLSEARAAAC